MNSVQRSWATTVFFVFLFTAISPWGYAKKNEVPEQDSATIVGASTLEATVSEQGKNVATIMNQMNEIVGRFQTMDGDIGRNDKKNQDQDKILKDNQVRLQSLEDKVSILMTQLQELRSEGLMKPASAQRFDDFKTYSKAVEGINAKNYVKAVTDLKAYQQAHPKSLYLSYAQYWIGEAFYLQADYEMAIAEFQKVLTRNPKSEKAPTALYKQGLAFYHLQSFDDAKEFFAKLIRTYPQSLEAAQAATQIEQINQILAAKNAADVMNPTQTTTQ